MWDTALVANSTLTRVSMNTTTNGKCVSYLNSTREEMRCLGLGSYTICVQKVAFSADTHYALGTTCAK